MRVETQFSVFLVNKPGVLAQVCRALAEAKVNIIALTMMDSMEHGVLRLVAGDAEKGRIVLRALNIPLTETDVLCVEMANKPGAMADICTTLADAHININYAYATTGAPGGKTIGVFRVADMKKAVRILSRPKPKRRDMTVKLRRPVPRR